MAYLMKSLPNVESLLDNFLRVLTEEELKGGDIDFQKLFLLYSKLLTFYTGALETVRKVTTQLGVGLKQSELDVLALFGQLSEKERRTIKTTMGQMLGKDGFN